VRGVEDIWPLTFKDDLDLDMSMLKNVQLSKIYTYAKYQVSISTGSIVMAKTLSLTLKNDLNHVTIQNMHFWMIHVFTKKDIAKTLYLTLKNDLDLDISPLEMCSFFEIHFFAKYQVSITTGLTRGVCLLNTTYAPFQHA